ncbi:MAG TPA: hypothetical protein VGD62_03700 [Acidobacteriaceae bacterium]
MKNLMMLAALTAALATALAAPALAQTGAQPSQPEKNPVELSITYSALRSNAPVGGCGCFWMGGGSAELAVPLWRYVSAVAEVSGQHTSHLPQGGGVGLSLLSGMGGLRVGRPMHTRFTPFGQGLVGGVHAFDSYFPGSTRSTTYATSMAMAAGLGIDVAVSSRILLRPVQAEYQYMQLPNNSTNQQHDIRLSAGVVLRLTH